MFSEWVEHWWDRHPRSLGAIALFIVSVLAIGAWRAYTYDKRPPVPQLSVRCSLGSLPVSPKDGDVHQVVVLHPKIDASFWSFETSNPWPELPTIGPNDPGDQIITCRLTNNESYALNDLRLTFEIAYFAFEVIPSSVEQKPDGTTSLRWQHDPAKGPSFAWQRDGESIAVRTGKLVVPRFRRELVVPLAAANSIRLIHLANQSRTVVEISQPVSGQAVVSGYPEHIPIQILRPGVNFLEGVTRYPIGPTSLNWQGLPAWP